jgi:hypothetical protein
VLKISLALTSGLNDKHHPPDKLNFVVKVSCGGSEWGKGLNLIGRPPNKYGINIKLPILN